MNIDKKIKGLGIEKISEVDKENKIKLADLVSTVLTDKFQNSKLNKDKIKDKLVNTKMYMANIPKKMSKANYIYMNSSIYFDTSLNLEKLDEFILHECIHKLQEYKNKKNRIIQLGTCNFSTTKIIGLGFNEATIQYIVSKVLDNEKRVVQMYGINLPVISGRYYAIVTNLIEQMVYLVGEETLVNSTINCNDDFLYKGMDNFGEKDFARIRNNFDIILSMQDDIAKLSMEKKEVKQSIEQLQNIYFETQELIATSYFDILLNMINTLQEVEQYKQKLLNYKSLTGKVGEYNFFDKYYEQQLIKVLKKEEKIKASTALVVVSNNPIFKAFRTIKKLFNKPNMEYDK